MDILDSSAILAFLKKEPGWKSIRDLLKKNKTQDEITLIHQINYIEIIYKCRISFGVQKTNAIISDLYTPHLGIVEELDHDMAMFSAYLKASYPASLADSIGLAYTKIRDCIFWTADKALLPIAKKEDIALELIR